jgi:hypothetical protein
MLPRQEHSLVAGGGSLRGGQVGIYQAPEHVLRLDLMLKKVQQSSIELSTRLRIS